MESFQRQVVDIMLGKMILWTIAVVGDGLVPEKDRYRVRALR